jgi:hypothetical protein
MKKFLLLCLVLLGFQNAQAAPNLSKSVTEIVTEPDPFAQGQYEFGATAGYLVSPVFAKKGRPKLNYAQVDLSLGMMLTSPAPLFGKNCLRGNWEALVNVCGMKVVSGPDGFLAGGRLLLRYNFVQPEARWVPFCQIGAGILGDDVYENRDQRLIGSGLEFTLVADAGLRYFINRCWAAILMADFEHISNANTASRNVGVNAAGGMLGLGYFF